MSLSRFFKSLVGSAVLDARRLEAAKLVQAHQQGVTPRTTMPATAALYSHG